MSLDIAQLITDSIIAELEKGATPWVKPWKTLRGTPGAGMPYNPVTGTWPIAIHYNGDKSLTGVADMAEKLYGWRE